MNTKLLLVEGIPGSGKSSFARRLYDFYTEKGIPAKLYIEGDFHPADLAWNAVLSPEQLSETIAAHPQLEGQIRALLHMEGGNAILPYTKVQTEELKFYERMSQLEIYDSRVPFEAFREILFYRWASFSREAAKEDCLHIFECAFMQNHINQLLFFEMLPLKRISDYLNELIATTLALSPLLIYLDTPDVRETILRCAKQRTGPGGSWIAQAAVYIEQTPYGKKHALRGQDGFIRAMKDRKAVELFALPRLPIQTHIQQNPSFDWENAWQELAKHLPVK